MTRNVIVYTDYKSPYAYVANGSIYALEEDFDIRLDWLPYTLDIDSYLDAVDVRTEHNWRKVRYAYMDARRFANRQGLTLKGPKKIYDTRAAQTAMLFAKAHGVFRTYNDEMFERFWNHSIDIEDRAQVQEALANAGAPAERFRGFLEGEGGAEHDRIRADAEARGVFGVPMLVFDDELFWGGDRVWLLRERLAEAGLAR
jgi:2-hydroxychromene-2-carboxylate isomerase